MSPALQAFARDVAIAEDSGNASLRGQVQCEPMHSHDGVLAVSHGSVEEGGASTEFRILHQSHKS